LALKAIEMVFHYPARSWDDPKDEIAREKMHNASCIAGMAFTNAFLGINHSLAHKLGGEFHIPTRQSQRTVIAACHRYNAQKPTSSPPFQSIRNLLLMRNKLRLQCLWDLEAKQKKNKSKI
jgi:acetaldehyde dehydrogenase/alcohol dehydrogenase